MDSSALQNYKKKLSKVQAELDKVRGCSALTHGWQTQRLAKAQRKWDILAQEKIRIKEQIEALTTPLS
jgi:predicted secreted hydrolase